MTLTRQAFDIADAIELLGISAAAPRQEPVD
jgi:hypothetical protein